MINDIAQKLKDTFEPNTEKQSAHPMCAAVDKFAELLSEALPMFERAASTSTDMTSALIQNLLQIVQKPERMPINCVLLTGDELGKLLDSGGLKLSQYVDLAKDYPVSFDMLMTLALPSPIPSAKPVA